MCVWMCDLSTLWFKITSFQLTSLQLSLSTTRTAAHEIQNPDKSHLMSWRYDTVGLYNSNRYKQLIFRDLDRLLSWFP